MRTCTKCGESKPADCFYFHSKRGRYEARCKGCFKAQVKDRADANREAVRAANRVAGAKFRDANRERERERLLAHYHANRDKYLAGGRKWRLNNPDKNAAKEAKRRAQLLKAIPKWADLEKIAEIYRKARNESARLGVEVVVDHIVPLQGRNVCGLHYEGNLQLLTKRENLSKGNRF
jgi:hypothetical protein